MRCRDVIDLSTEYIDGELDERRASALRGHLRVCDSCRDRVADEAALRDAADELGPVDPPPQLWARIQQGLADEEIADSRRSRLWLWLPRLRQAALPAAVAVAAAVALFIYMRRGHQDSVAQSEPPAATADRSPTQTPAAEESFLDNLAQEIAATDRRYRSTIRELRQIAEAERSSWPEGSAARFDAAIARFNNTARVELQKLTVATAVPDSRDRDALHALYQSHIRYLQQAALGEPR
jgi:hypothetical protein